MSRVPRLLLGLLLVAVSLLPACTPATEPPSAAAVQTAESEATAVPTPPRGGRLIYGLLFSPSGMDPHAHSSWDMGIAVSNVYDPLVYQDDAGAIQPGLAESWEISDDGKTYTFKLRAGVKFHDGTTFNAAAVKFSLDRIVDPETKSQYAITLLGPYESSEVVNDLTVRVQFSEPYAPFLANLGLPFLAMVSPAAVEKWGADYQLHQVGTGPFIFQEYVPNERVTLRRNPDYNWSPAGAGHEGPAYLDEIIIRYLPDAATRVPALEAGDVHVARELLPQQTRRLQEDPAFTVLVTAMPGQTMQFFMNTQRTPTDDVRVRQALLHAVDPTAIANTIFQGYFPPAHGPLAADTFGYNPNVEGMYPYDVAKAEALLEEAGWTDSDGDGIRDRDGEPLTLEMIVQNWGHLEEIGQIVQGQLRQAGVDVRIEMLSFPAAVQAAADGAYHLTPYGGGGWDPDVLRAFFASDAYFNWSKVDDAELDAWLAEAAGAMEPARRAELYGQAQERIMQQALVLPVLSDGQIVGISNAVHDLRYDPIGLFPRFYDAYIAQ